MHSLHVLPQVVLSIDVLSTLIYSVSPAARWLLIVSQCSNRSPRKSHPLSHVCGHVPMFTLPADEKL